eukprot:TRINITY_DN1723_c0_g1_i1.p1 TRINITY_DN1723_c0_g1~~TRINITY_DN1723_c0_g1_i1.p1  ORF type:complete len:308 (-),score=59.35 TRINITY_DN1723_c0_g1_i1:1492-2415(-)
MMSRSRSSYNTAQLGTLLACVVVALLTVVSHDDCQVSAQRSDMYFSMVDNILSESPTYYELLGVDSYGETKEIKRAFRMLSRTMHPDKRKDDPNAEDNYALLVTASNVLTDEEMRAEYDDLLTYGVPWQDRYYGRHAHNWGAPDHDIRYVLTYMIVFITLAKYFYQVHRHKKVYGYARESTLFKQKMKQYEFEMKRKHRGNDPFPEMPSVEVKGVEMPTWRDVFVVQLVFLPWTSSKLGWRFAKWIVWEQVMGHGPSEEDLDEQARIANNMTKEEWDAQKSKHEERRERMMSSGKAKRYRRWMKKQR